MVKRSRRDVHEGNNWWCGSSGCSRHDELKEINSEFRTRRIKICDEESVVFLREEKLLEICSYSKTERKQFLFSIIKAESVFISISSLWQKILETVKNNMIHRESSGLGARALGRKSVCLKNGSVYHVELEVL